MIRMAQGPAARAALSFDPPPDGDSEVAESQLLPGLNALLTDRCLALAGQYNLKWAVDLLGGRRSDADQGREGVVSAA
jgi:hypothetical protein